MRSLVLVVVLVVLPLSVEGRPPEASDGNRAGRNGGEHAGFNHGPPPAGSEGTSSLDGLTISLAEVPERSAERIEPASEPLAIRSVTPASARVRRYERLELTVDLGATYDNPFDPDDVRLDGVFTSPSGRTLVVPGFFTVDYRREVDSDGEAMIAQPQRGWQVRFTPQEIGEYRWRLELRDRSGAIEGGEGRLECTAGSLPGFVRTSKVDPHYLAFDNGKGFFAIGHNLPIYHTTGQLGDEASASSPPGENFTVVDEFRGLESNGGTSSGGTRQDVAARSTWRWTLPPNWDCTT